MGEFLYPNIGSVEIDDDALIRHVQENYDPEGVFPDSELRDWAERNGFIHEEEVD